ncbi:vitamin H transporter [Naematelia encephala]|uniref:Vitamin H transporter n=1 Tax=Naematelia encephala TaxID=71784 RepID=A0A1Y2AX22_9TREE|nr:vitamin H transporter [Naematelia encephala]
MSLEPEEEVKSGSGPTTGIHVFDVEGGGKVLDKKHDKALELLADEPSDYILTDEDSTRIRKKIDRHILPLLVITVLLQNLDKATLAYGALMGLKKDTHLTPGQYTWLGSLVYWGFLAWELPTHYLLQRLPVARYAAVTVLIWGTILCCHAAATNFAGLAACRFLLGVAECTVTPAFVIITGAWYTPAEQIQRVAFWFGTAALSQVIGGLLAYGMYHAPSFRWEGLFLLFGGITLVHGVCLVLFLAASPSQAKFLTKEEKIIALERVRIGKAGSEQWGFNKDQLKEALLDIRLYLFFLIMICTGLPNGGVGAFGPTIISNFGFSAENTTLLGMAPGVSEFIGIVLITRMAKYTGSRAWSGFTAICVAIIGIIMMLAIPSHKYIARFAGYCLLFWWPIIVIFIISFLTSSISGTTKKLCFNAAYNLGYCIGNLVGPFTYQSYDAPNYYIAKFTMLAFVALSGVITLTILFIHKRENAKRDRRDALNEQNGVVVEHVNNSEFLDLTDKQQAAFRYPY